MENELDHLKQKLENINFELKIFLEDHHFEDDPHKILVLWGRLQYMIEIKMYTEMSIERIEEELKHGKSIL